MPDEPRTVDHDRYDDLTWLNTLGRATALRDLLQRGRTRHPGFGGLMADLFAGFYKVDPRLLPPGNANRWQRDVVRKTWETASWEQTREGSVLDETLSALGVLAAGEAIFDELQPPGTEDGGADSSPDSSSGPPTGPLARAAARAAQKQVAETEECFAAWGIDPSQLQHLPLDRRIALARELTRNANLKRLADTVGAMRAFAAGAHRSRLTARTGATTGIHTGADPARLLPQEIALLGHPATRAEGMRRLATRSALLWQRKLQQKTGRGPLIVLCDASGSTKHALSEGLSIEGAIRAVALGLGEIASRQRRAWAGIVFSGPGDFATFLASRGHLDPESLLQFATASYGGGTDWDGPLREAMRLIDAESDLTAADIVLVTDGICQLSEDCTAEIATRRRAKGTHVLGLLVGDNPADTLRPFCDQVVVTADLLRAAETVIRDLATDRSA